VTWRVAHDQEEESVERSDYLVCNSLVWRFYQKEPVIYVEKYYPDLCAVLQSCDCVVSWKTQASLKVKTLLFVERAAVTDMHRSLMFDEYGYEIVSN